MSWVNSLNRTIGSLFDPVLNFFVQVWDYISSFFVFLWDLITGLYFGFNSIISNLWGTLTDILNTSFFSDNSFVFTSINSLFGSYSSLFYGLLFVIFMIISFKFVMRLIFGRGN